MRRQTWIGLLTGAGIVIAGGSVSAEELTIFWAEWDPANYLQELVNQYTAETGVKVTVETTTWPDFQAKAFVEFNAHGDSYDLVVGDSQWLGAARRGALRRADRFRQGAPPHRSIMTPASMTYYSEYPKGSGRYWAVPLEADAIGWAYRKDWFEDPTEMRPSRQNTATTSPPRRPGSNCATSPSSSIGRRQSAALRRRHLYGNAAATEQ